MFTLRNSYTPSTSINQAAARREPSIVLDVQWPLGLVQAPLLALAEAQSYEGHVQERSAQQLAHQRIQTQSLHTLDFMHVRAGGLTLHARHAPICASKGDPAPNRRRW